MTDSNVRFPNFLIIGAMKAGTTTVFRDLETQPQIFFPVHKEPTQLCFDTVLTEEGRARYGSIFRKARPDQLCGEASTGYTKLPVYQGVPQRARRILGPDLKMMYRVREPVARALSHHFHLYLEGTAPASIEETLHQTPDLIDFSRYAMQIEPWIDTFGRNQVHIGELEAYSGDRRKGLCELCEFLGIEEHPELIEEDVIFHAATDGRKTPSWMVRPLRKLTWNHSYKFLIRPLIPGTARTWVRRMLSRPAPPPPPPPGPAVIDRIIDALRDDSERLRQIMGREVPLWDFEAVRAKYVSAERRAKAAV